MNLNANYIPPGSVKGLNYNPEINGIGIVHFGVGAFHRAHQAVYTDAVLERHGGDWRILGVSLQSTRGADALNAQDGIYSLAIRVGQERSLDVKLIGSIAGVVAATRGTDVLFETLALPQTRIVTMTVTEKAYGINRDNGRVDPLHDSIARDLKDPDSPTGIIGIIVKGLRLRKSADLRPFTVLCCDNLPKNGELVRAGVLDFAKRVDVDLADWIAQNGAFPSSMVDRITPAVVPNLLIEVAKILGVVDQAAVETESFSQWVIEDDFCNGRPKWQEVGVLFVEDVAPYERMKLQMLNGTHSLIAYAGFLSGHKYVCDAMNDPVISNLATRHIEAASNTLEPLKGIDFCQYGQGLISRFKNPNIAHETYQVAMDGTQKLPQRIFEPALDSLNSGLPVDAFALVTAIWMRYCMGRGTSGEAYVLRDPRHKELSSIFTEDNHDVSRICKAFFALPNFMQRDLAQNNVWTSKVERYLKSIISTGLNKTMQSVIDEDS